MDGDESSGLSGLGADGVAINYGHIDSTTHGILIDAVGERSQAINAGLTTARGRHAMPTCSAAQRPPRTNAWKPHGFPVWAGSVPCRRNRSRRLR